MSTIGRLMQGDLSLSGEIDERLPSVTDGLIAHFPFDGTSQGLTIGYIYNNDNEWTTNSIVDGASYTINNAGIYDSILLEAEIYLESTPSERYTVIKTNYAGSTNTQVYLSVDSSRRVSVYNYGHSSVGYHASDRVLELNTWYKVAMVTHPSGFIIFIDGTVDKLISSTRTIGVDISSINIGAENSSRHFQGKIKNTKVDIYNPIPTIDTDNYISYDGINVEEASINLMSGISMTKDNYTGITHGSDEKGDYFIKSSNAPWYGGIRVPNVSVQPGLTYSFSIEVMCDKPFSYRWDANVASGEYTGNDSARLSSSYYPSSYTKVGEWERVTLTATVHGDASSPVVSDSFCPSESAYAGYKIYYRNPTMVQKQFPISNVNTHGSDSKLMYRYTLQIPISISLKYEVDNNKDVGSRKYLFAFENDNSLSDYFSLYFQDNKFILESSNSYLNTSTISVTNSLLNGAHTFTATLNSSSMKLYIDDSEVGSVSNPHLPSSTLYLKIGNGPDINLLTNGSAEYDDNTNFSSFTYTTSDSSDGDGKAFYRTSGSSTIYSDEYIPVDPYQIYRLEGSFKTGTDNVQSRLYFGVACFDKNKSLISHEHCTHYINTRTTLAQPLNNGDTVVYLTSAANWSATSPGAYHHTKTLGVWYNNGYPNYTYTRTIAYYLDVDTIANTLTLQNAWSGGAVPAGTPVADMYSGGSYNYIAASNALIQTTWTRYSANISGLGGGSGGVFRWGTKYIKLLFLMNREGITTPTTMIDNMVWKQLNSNYNANNTIKNVSLYDRVLPLDEVKKLSNDSFSIQKDGDIIGTTLIEKPIGIDSDAIYFPLDLKTSDQFNLINPSSESNTSYNNGVLWVGQSTTNLLSGYLISPETKLNGYSGWKITGVANDNPRKYLDSNSIPVSASTTYTFSAIYWSSDGVLDDVYLQFNDSGWTEGSIYHQPFIGQGGRSTVVVSDLGGGFKRYSATFTTNAETTSIVNIFFDSDVAGREIFIGELQLEQKPFATPYVDGTRGNTVLNYSSSNLNISAGAIIGWWNFNESSRTWRGPSNNNDYKMLFSTYGAGERNKLNIRSYYGYGSNTWYAQTSNSTPSSTSITLTIPDGWHMICMAWDKTNSKMKVFIDDRLIQEVSGAYLPDSYERDLQIGQWDSPSVWGAMNQYMKDLIILKHYPSNDEIINLYKNQMRSLNGKLLLQGIINENSTLN